MTTGWGGACHALGAQQRAIFAPCTSILMSAMGCVTSSSNRTTRFADLSYVKRLLLDTWADPGSEPGSHGSDEELVRVNGAIFREFIRLADANGALALLAYFPGRPEILQLAPGEQTAGQRIMKEIGVPFVDTTPCILEVGPDAGYVPNDTHYSAAGNAAVSKCLGVLAEDKARQPGSTPR
jgi:hypothetical protein